jgi:DNA-binding transcriptional LysR family regulator
LDCDPVDAVHQQCRGTEGRGGGGRGIALLPTFIAGADIQQGRLTTLLTRYKAPEISIYAIYPETRHLSPKVRVFIDFLVERFGGRPYWDLVE